MIIKQSNELLENALESIKDKADLINHPFESIFSTFIPGFLLVSHPVYAIILFLLDASDYGLGNIGKYIDQSLNFGSENPDVSDSKLKDVSDNIMTSILGKIGITSKSSSNISLIKLARKSKYGDMNMFGKWWNKNQIHGKGILVNLLWKLLKTFVVGLIGVGVIGGFAGMLKEKTKEKELPQIQETSSKVDLYANTKNNVEDTLIEFLDNSYSLRYKDSNTYYPFSKIFEEMNGYKLKGSKDMEEIIKIVDEMNTGNIDEKSKFLAPKIEFIAKKLIPTLKIEKDFTEKQIKTEPKFKRDPKIKREAPKQIDNKELLNALRGIYK